MVLHNSFIFSLAFVMIFSGFHLYTLMNFVLCFAGVAEGRAFAAEWKFPSISQLAKFRAFEKFLKRALFIFHPLCLLQPFISYEIH